MYDTRNNDDKQNAKILIRLCQVTFPCVIKYNDITSNILQVPFSMALSKGNKCVNDGVTSGVGNILRLSITTTANTNTDMAATKRNINLSVIFLRDHDPRVKNQDYFLSVYN